MQSSTRTAPILWPLTIQKDLENSLGNSQICCAWLHSRLSRRCSFTSKKLYQSSGFPAASDVIERVGPLFWIRCCYVDLGSVPDQSALAHGRTRDSQWRIRFVRGRRGRELGAKWNDESEG